MYAHPVPACHAYGADIFQTHWTLGYDASIVPHLFENILDLFRPSIVSVFEHLGEGHCE